MDRDLMPGIQELQSFLDQHGDKPTLRVAAVLLAQHEVPKAVIADAFGVSVKTVYNWIERFSEEAVETAPYDEPRPGAPPELTSTEQRTLLETLWEPPSESGYEDDAWTLELAQEYIRDRFGVSYSERHVRRILQDASMNRDTHT